MDILLIYSTFHFLNLSYYNFILTGMLSAAASLGLIHLWDVDGGLTPIDKYLYTTEDYIKVGIEFLTLICDYFILIFLCHLGRCLVSFGYR